MFEILEGGLARAGCNALLVVAESARDPDLAPFVGAAHLGRCLLVLPRDGSGPRLGYLTAMERDEAAATGLALLAPEDLDAPRLGREVADPVAVLAALLVRALARSGVSSGPVALAGHAGSGLVYAACRGLEARGWSFASGHALLRLFRKRKSAGQLAAVRHAAAGTCAAFRRVAELLAAAVVRGGELWLEGERLAVARLRAEVARVLAEAGLEQPAGNILAAGSEAGVPHTQGSSARVLRPSEPLVVDLFPRGLVYADCTRTLCVGRPSAELAAAHAAVQAALAKARAVVRPGLAGWEAQEAVCGVLAAAGYPTPISHPDTAVGYVHGLGHGVGFELHEYPSFRRPDREREEGRLAAGDVFTLEPGLYDPGAGYGVRLEDLVALGDGGLENLTPLPYDLDPRAWAT